VFIFFILNISQGECCSMYGQFFQLGEFLIELLDAVEKLGIELQQYYEWVDTF
jgi:hypothetical protein